MFCFLASNALEGSRFIILQGFGRIHNGILLAHGFEILLFHLDNGHCFGMPVGCYVQNMCITLCQNMSKPKVFLLGLLPKWFESFEKVVPGEEKHVCISLRRIGPTDLFVFELLDYQGVEIDYKTTCKTLGPDVVPKFHPFWRTNSITQEDGVLAWASDSC